MGGLDGGEILWGWAGWVKEHDDGCCTFPFVLFFCLQKLINVNFGSCMKKIEQGCRVNISQKLESKLLKESFLTHAHKGT